MCADFTVCSKTQTLKAQIFLAVIVSYWLISDIWFWNRIFQYHICCIFVKFYAFSSCDELDLRPMQTLSRTIHIDVTCPVVYVHLAYVVTSNVLTWMICGTHCMGTDHLYVHGWYAAEGILGWHTSRHSPCMDTPTCQGSCAFWLFSHSLLWSLKF